MLLFFLIFTSFLVASTQRLLAAWFETLNQRDENQEESKQVTTLQFENWDPSCPIVRKNLECSPTFAVGQNLHENIKKKLGMLQQNYSELSSYCPYTGRLHKQRF